MDMDIWIRGPCAQGVNISVLCSPATHPTPHLPEKVLKGGRYTTNLLIVSSAERHEKKNKRPNNRRRRGEMKSDFWRSYNEAGDDRSGGIQLLVYPSVSLAMKPFLFPFSIPELRRF
jgi:hypothetical protein